MEEIIDDLLTAAGPRDEWQPDARVSVATVAAAAWEMVATGDATLRVRGDLTVDGNRSSLRRLFENLFRNSVEHGGPTVTVTADTDPPMVVVEDDGPGIDPARRERVFEPGYSTDRHGTGFGLFIVRDIALVHGWDVRLGESDTGGFRIEFLVDRPGRVTE
jgi:signal transduction histidine kinase